MGETTVDVVKPAALLLAATGPAAGSTVAATAAEPGGYPGDRSRAGGRTGAGRDPIRSLRLCRPLHSCCSLRSC
ncbi:hypothetical protein [Streptomyces hirsutus]|uniref:hypothetical protein n=2 Tax=Streptomyces hirsutus TaxID=35620 RepID=UPI00332AD847